MCGEKALTHHGTGGGALGGPMCVGKARYVEPAERQRQGVLHVYGEGTNSQMLTTLAREVSSCIWGRHPWTAAERFPWIVFPIYMGRHRIAGGCGLYFGGFPCVWGRLFFTRHCHSMWLLHLHSAVKMQPFSPVFPLAESTANAFCRLILWNFKEKNISHFLWHSQRKNSVPFRPAPPRQRAMPRPPCRKLWRNPSGVAARPEESASLHRKTNW